MTPVALAVRRPVATTLLALGLLLTGLVAFRALPVASLPTVEIPTIRVSASRPGADPETMAASVAAPLERRLGAIAGLVEMSSTSGQGATSITLQFTTARPLDRVAIDVQAAINAAMTDLPTDLAAPPILRKANPFATPIVLIALTSRTLAPSAIFDVADTLVVQRLSQIPGVGAVLTGGAEQPAVRIEVEPLAVARAGLTLEQVRAAVVGANALSPAGAVEGQRQRETIALDGQLSQADAYHALLLRAANGTVVRLTDVANVVDGVRNTRAYGTYDGRPAVILTITRSADANVVETATRVREAVESLRRSVPAEIEIAVMSDRTGTIRASVHDMQMTVGLSLALVMGVVFLFLRRIVPTIAAAVAIPLSFAGTFAGMWVVGFSLDNISLMALAISIGFVVDDAIVVTENVGRRIEAGAAPMQAAIEGGERIAFTVIAISIALIAALLPLFFMADSIGAFFREFAGVVAFAILVSTVCALTVTPMICGQWLQARRQSRPSRIASSAGNLYERSLRLALRAPAVLIVVLVAAIGGTAYLYRELPKGYFPEDDTGLLFGWTQAAPDISFDAMRELQERAAGIVAGDPAVAHVGSFIGNSSWIESSNSGRLFIALKPLAERGLRARRVVARLRERVRRLAGIEVSFWAVQDVRAGSRGGRSDYQLTLWSPDVATLRASAAQVAERLRAVPGLVDVSADQQSGGLQLDVVVDRELAGRLGIAMRDVNAALNSAFAQRQIATVYGARNQYRIVMSIPTGTGTPADLLRVHVPAAGGRQVPLTAIARTERSLVPMAVYHQGQFPAASVYYGVTPDMPLGTALAAIRRAVNEMQLPESIRVEFAGDAGAFERTAASQPLLILAGLVAIYLVLGIVYESFVHPLTILSTLPSAALGALLALKINGMELSLVAFMGIVLLIGLVMKNGILLVDFALEAARQRGLSAADAAVTAARERLRPIMMTSFAGLLGALPFLFGEGPGAELRRPLGVTIIGGLLVAQVLTLYTTPAVYVMFDRLRRNSSRRSPALRERTA